MKTFNLPKLPSPRTGFLENHLSLLKNQLHKLGQWHFVCLDLSIFLITPLLALDLRMDQVVPLEAYTSGLLLETIVFLITKFCILHYFGFYRRYWRHASIDEVFNLVQILVTTIILQTLAYQGLFYLTAGSIYPLPRSVPFLDALLSILIVGGLRFSIRATEKKATQLQRTIVASKPVLIVGAGYAGTALVREMQEESQFELSPVAFIDDDPRKWNLEISGLPVVGDRYKIPQAVRDFNIAKIVIAMPSVGGSAIREIVAIAQATGVETSTLPSLQEILSGQAKVATIRDIRIEDLLRRSPIQTDFAKVSQLLTDQRVLITGAGGSIGSEICRQILKCCPKEIILLGKGENSIFLIQQELQQTLQTLQNQGEQLSSPKLTAVIADIRSVARLEYVFARFKPTIVFHAAAHKHVPLMELNPSEAITCNVMGTKNLVDMAVRHGVNQFVMISTDKAVNPTNVMGASKRTAEMLVLQAAKQHNKPYVVVRFGNVLGSRGSVVPTFQRLIEAGGPITVTHPDICRFFMTIPEAVQLVLQAAVLGHGGEVMMLDMGKPVKIVDLAKDMIRLSGYKVGEDIDIVFTGLRPGEKLYEELFLPGEQYERTQHEKILIARNASQQLPANLDNLFQSLCQAAENHDTNLIIFLLEQLVDGYKPNRPKSVEPTTSSTSTMKVEISNMRVAVSKNQTSGGAFGGKTSQELGYASGGISSLSHCPNNLLPYLLDNALQEAFSKQEFCLHYQPIINLKTSQIVGFEALLRWQHPQLGLISSAGFIRAAEDTGVIVPMGWWVIHEACQRLYLWKQQALQANAFISFNFSLKQIFQPDVTQRLTSLLQEADLPISSVVLEIPADIVKVNVNQAVQSLQVLKDAGFQLQLQLDHQVGLISSRSLSKFRHLLSQYFVDIKVKCPAVQDSGERLVDSEELQDIIVLAQSMGIGVIATNIESFLQLTWLRSHNCQRGQGYLLAKPMSEDTVTQLLDQCEPNKVLTTF